jgi:ADP-ribose pyrophosphatase YjhB (NUDIX family)
MLKPYNFCASCGAKLNEPGEEDERACPSCGRTWYRSSAPTAGAAIVKDGRALVTQRGTEPEKGKFDVPGGFLKAGEDALVGLRRELDEELKIEVDVSMDDCLQMVPHEYGGAGDWVLSIGFKARLTRGQPTPGSDVAEARWITLEELDDIDFAWEHDRELVRKALRAATEE